MGEHEDASWSTPEMVASFVQSQPNPRLLQFAEATLAARPGRARALDLGCGAGRNAIPLARGGWTLLGIDMSRPMLAAAAERASLERVGYRVQLALASMDDIPARGGAFDLVIAHGIWNLAGSAAQFRRAVQEAARVAAPDAALFVFTFSRHTLPPDAEPLPGEPFTFTQFSGRPQCFLTEDQLRAELASARFVPDPLVPIRELNRPGPGALLTRTVPVIYEGVFRSVA